MDITEPQNQLLELLYGELSPEQEAELRRAIDGDEELARQWQELKTTHEEIEKVIPPPEEVPEPICESILSAASEHANKQSRREDGATTPVHRGMWTNLIASGGLRSIASVAVMLIGSAVVLVLLFDSPLGANNEPYDEVGTISLDSGSDYDGDYAAAESQPAEEVAEESAPVESEELQERQELARADGPVEADEPVIENLADEDGPGAALDELAQLDDYEEKEVEEANEELLAQFDSTAASGRSARGGIGSNDTVIDQERSAPTESRTPSNDLDTDSPRARTQAPSAPQPRPRPQQQPDAEASAPPSLFGAGDDFDNSASAGGVDAEASQDSGNLNDQDYTHESYDDRAAQAEAAEAEPARTAEEDVVEEEQEEQEEQADEDEPAGPSLLQRAIQAYTDGNRDEANSYLDELYADDLDDELDEEQQAEAHQLRERLASPPAAEEAADEAEPRPSIMSR